MADVNLVQGDTRPSIEGALKITSTNAVLDLTAAGGVKFQMRQDNDRHYTVDADAAITDPDAGLVRYDWQDGDLSVPGDYICQWEIAWDDGTYQTTEPANTITVRRQ